MKKPFVLFLFVLILSIACSTSPSMGGLFATETPTPTSTFTPTATSTPTETPTPTSTATATPNATATAAFRATETAGGVLAELEALITDEKDTDIDYKSGYLAWKQKDPVSITLNQPGGEYYDIPKLKLANFIMKSDVTWDTTGLILCGTMFRSDADFEKGRQYQFIYLRMSGTPAWAIQFHEFGYFKNTISDVRFSSALNLDNGATNQFVLVANNEVFTVYINGVRQGRFYDNSQQATNGGIAFVAFEDSGKSTCQFENSWIWALK